MKLFRAVKSRAQKLSVAQRLMVAGLVGVTLIYLGAAGIHSFTVPWGFTDGDQIAHLDLIWRLYKGELPNVLEGVTYKPFIDIGAGNIYQRAVGHPPLFHLLHAPIVGYLMDRGAWELAIAVGRSINLVFGVVGIGVLAWAGWLFGGRRKELFAVTVPALAVTAYRFLRLNKDFAMDGLVVIETSLALILIHKIIQNGLQKKYLVWFGILSVIGVATKVSFIPFLGIGCLVIVWVGATYNQRNKFEIRGAMKGFAIASAIGLAAVSVIGWYFYFKNFRASGNFVTPLPNTFTGGREYQSWPRILFGDAFWSIFYGKYTVVPELSIAVTSFVLAGLLSIRKSKWVNALRDRATRLSIAAIAASAISMAAIQLYTAHPYGAINFRYMLPAILPIALLFSYGLLEFRQTRGQLVAIVAILSAWTTVLSIRMAPTVGMLTGVDKWPVTVRKIFGLGLRNHIPVPFMSFLFIALGIGAVLLSVSLFRLAKLTDPVTD